MKDYLRFVLIGWGISLILGMGACSTDEGCKEGAQEPCLCAGEPTGTQTCANGQWGTCDCECTPQCSGKDCGPDGCGGQCGACDQPPASTCLDADTEKYHDEQGTCEEGTCSYTAHQRTCTLGCANNGCVADPCDALTCDQPPSTCHTATGVCVREPEPHCQYSLLEDGASCDDGVYCNGQETCRSGECQPGAPVDCSAEAGACQTPTCDEESSQCTVVPLPDDTPCDDGIYCNGAETCQSGDCVPGTAIDCSDLDDVCKTGDCSEPLKKCVARSLPNDTPCADDLICNGDEVCRSGECVPGRPLVCAQPFNRCKYAECIEAKGGCVEKTLDDYTECDDINPCTLGEVCLGGECTPDSIAEDNTPCDDHNPCTAGERCLEAACEPAEQICDGTVAVMMYMDADNNLDEYMTDDWHEMESAHVEDIPWLRVFVLIDHAGVGDSRFYEVLNGHSKEMDAPTLGLTVAANEELNMGDGATLTGFIQDVKSVVGPDAGLFLILSDHGDGWRQPALLREPLTRGTCYDDHSNNDFISTRELHTAVAGQGLQLIGFDACLEGMAEVAYELRNDALVMVASQETEPGDGWEFTGLLYYFGHGGDPSPFAFGQIAVETYMDSYGSTWGSEDITQAAFDLSRMDALATAASAAATAMTSVGSTTFNQICTAMDWYGCVWGMCTDHTDLIHLAEVAMEKDAGASAIYQTLRDATDAAVIVADHNSGHPDAHGLNIYFPCAETFDNAYSATNLQWAGDTNWDDMLKAH